MRRRWAVAPAVAAVLAVAGAAAALGHGARGVLTTYEADGRPSASFMNLGTRPGNALVFDLYVVNHSTHPVRVDAVRLLPLPGYPLPQLAGAGLVHGNIAAGLTRGWPPPQVHGLSPLVGSTLGPGTSDLGIAITGTRLGTSYGTVGVELTYTDDAFTHHVRVYGGAVVCVQADITKGCPDRVRRDDQRVFDYIHAQ